MSARNVTAQNVPPNWDVRRLKSICSLAYGDSLPDAERSNGEIPVYGSNGKIGTHVVSNTDGPSIVIGRKGSFGKVHFSEQPAFAIDTTYFVDRNYTHADLRWLFYLLASSGLDTVSRDSAIPGLNRDDAYRMACPYPPPEEQAAIVRYLDHADELISRYIGAKERLIALLEEQRQAVIHQAVTRGLDPNAPSKQSSVEWLADVPQHWQLPEIKQVSKILRGKFAHRPRNDPSLYGGIYPFIQTGDVAAANGIIRTHRQTLNQQGLAVSTMFPAGTLVMTIAANIGDVAVLNFEACFPDSIVGFVPTNKVERDFLYYLFRAMKSEFLREAPVNTQGNLNVERIGSRKIPLPSVDEQVTIVRHLAEVSAHIDASMELAHRQVSLIGEYRTRLIADVVTGQIAVRDAVVELPGQHL